ncbi:MAG: hypothetical protein CFE26_08935 [Verrucomicrobiales bacterium VVV1]|nr:MAG: hypothetical protein CFE26_08935 [Verrucomicrobiales bacterium VVV1]
MNHSTLLHFDGPSGSNVVSILQISVAILLLTERGAPNWTMLIGSILNGVCILVRWISINFVFSGDPLPDPANDTLIAFLRFLRPMEIAGTSVFLIGLLHFALRRRALSARIAELEQIIAAQNSRLQ